MIAIKKKIIAGILLGVVALTIVFAAISQPGGNAAGSSQGKGEVGIIYIEGVIANGQPGGAFGDQIVSEDVAAALREAARDPGLKAVVIRLNSPGGTAAAAQEIGAEVERLRKSGKKVVASMGDTAASGAYWIAAGTDRIVANPGTMTGSIGVIMERYDLQGLYGKIGVDTETFKSGPYKDMGSSSRPSTPEERAIFQSMIDDIYSQFVEYVAQGRHMDVPTVRALADGRVYTGRQAKELGLVDQLGDFHDAVLLAGSLAGIPGEPTVVELGPKNIFRELFGAAGGNALWQSAWPFLPYLGEAERTYQLQ
ncbi:signal peptide peptidase SppA [Pelotomaculum propionicicum]|uniref:signal peptide peptidase SppA n=1 Tax=Pelotomaculum propionicicum TaxID=258475 RepID=UPI003B77ECD9